MLSGLTYNVFLGRNLEALLEWLYDENKLLDLYCFQEFPEDKIPDINKHIGNASYKFRFAPGFTWRNITYGELTVFKKDKIELLGTQTITLGGKGELNLVFIREGFNLEARIARFKTNKTALLTTFRHGKRQLSLVNTHLNSDIHNSRKLQQLDRILNQISDDSPAIILGDFNYAAGWKLPKLMAQHNFLSAIKKQKTYRFAKGIYWQNDYIFQRKCPINNVQVRHVRHSDHYPIFFEIAS